MLDVLLQSILRLTLAPTPPCAGRPRLPIQSVRRPYKVSAIATETHPLAVVDASQSKMPSKRDLISVAEDVALPPADPVRKHKSSSSWRRVQRTSHNGRVLAHDIALHAS